MTTSTGALESPEMEKLQGQGSRDTNYCYTLQVVVTVEILYGSLHYTLNFKLIKLEQCH